MILLVEDDAITRMATAQALRTSGREVLEAGNGEEALRLLADHPSIKLVVMDFVLPGIDGFKLMDLIHERRPKLPIILVSGYLSQRAGDAIVGLPSKADKYFAKPFRPSALVKTVQELLGST
jgi:CheY-like chemotaxis protein